MSKSRVGPLVGAKLDAPNFAVVLLVAVFMFFVEAPDVSASRFAVARAAGRTVRPTFLSLPGGIERSHVLTMRGGSVDYDDDESYDEYDEYDEGEEEEEEEVVPAKRTLAKSAVAAAEKAREKKATAAKKAASAAIASMPKKKKRSGSGISKRVPYIVRACLNPLTVFAMTKAYFASLFNINYLEEESSQGLRSALEEKAKKSGTSGGGRKGKRTMKPGQAKTLSDLPQLSA